MKKEWWVDIHAESWPDYAEGIVIGDEGCIYRTLIPNWLPWVDRANESGLTVRLETPPVPNNKVEELFSFIQKIAGKTNLKVTFNDFGMLYRCKELIEKTLIIPVVGRIITRSIMDCPWYDELLKHENPELTSAVTGGNFVHRSKWEILKRYNIHEIELNINYINNLERLRSSGLVLTGNLSNSLISVGRLCYSARWQGLMLPECCNDARCLRKLSIQLNQKWGKLKLIYENPSEPVKDKYRDLFVRGNAVYKEIDRETNLNLGFNIAIFR
jgi:hypothetical protein